jgi:hypothetical protein
VINSNNGGGKQLKLADTTAVIAAAALLCVAANAPAAASDTNLCGQLTTLKLDKVEIQSARTQPADAPVEGAHLPSMTGALAGGALIAKLPAFCRVIGRIHPEAGSDIHFEVWMPSAGWDHRFYGLGTGGFAGSIDYMALGSALQAGEAAVSTDTGHSGGANDSSWAKGHPERVRDYGWRAIHVTTVAAKKLVAAFYHHDADHAYFVGCSNGGRQGLMEASRFPDDYDGIVAGAPAAVWTDLALSMINHVQAQLPPGATIRSEQAHLLQDEVLKQCDALDGHLDGVVDDARLCKLDVSKLACGVSSSPQCFSEPQLTALKQIYAGPRDASGHQLTAAYLASGSEVGTPFPPLGWEGYILGGSSGQPGGGVLVGGLLKDVVQSPFATPATFDFNKDPARLKSALAADLDAQPNLHQFFDHGGKLILWHGWADAAIPPEATLKFHQSILLTSGPRARDSVRLFMVPGVQHCLGGSGPDLFGEFAAPQPSDTPERNIVTALQSWVENGRAVDSLVGRRGFGGFMGMPEPRPERQRLLCAYPGKAILRPGGDLDQASNYRCQVESDGESTKGADVGQKKILD